VADALDYAFSNGIIHRDVKPGNIMIDRRGKAHLLDLGLARFLNDHTDQLTLKYDDKIVLGTADYVAPEQIENSHAVDTRADIYALGATFYFLLAGHPPFPTGTVSQKLLWHRTRMPAPIESVREEIPATLAKVVARMMAKDPKDRYQTPAQLMSDLDEWLPSSIPLPRLEEFPKLSPAAMLSEDQEVSPAERRAPTAGATSFLAVPGRSSSAMRGTRCEARTSSGIETQPRARKSVAECETEEAAALMTTPSLHLSLCHRPQAPRSTTLEWRWNLHWLWVAASAVAAAALTVLVLR
jgi:serine/threonine protein kinase